jgi:integrase/recombinase XerD
MKALEQHILERHSPRALYGYMRTIRQYISYLGEATAKAAVYSQIVGYIGVLRKQGMHPKTLRNYLFAIKMYYQWLVDSGQRDDHPCRDLHLKDQINRAIAVESLYTKREMENMLNSYVGELPLVRRRDSIVLSLLVHQAVTNIEIIELKVSDFDLHKGVLNLKGSVKTMPRVLPLKSEQIMLMNDYIRYCRPLFLRNNPKPTAADKEALILANNGRKMGHNTLSAIFRKPLANGQKINMQKVRQSAIAHLLKTGKDLRVVQAFTGHKHLSSVEEYRQTGLEEMKNIIQKLHPLQ